MKTEENICQWFNDLPATSIQTFELCNQHFYYHWMLVTLTIIRYPKYFILFALLAMAFHRFPLWLNKKISFYKLLGCGKNGTFDKHPDWQQWGILSVNTLVENMDTDKEILIKNLYGSFIAGWFKLFSCETCIFLLQPLESHGRWDGKEPFGMLPKQTDYYGPVAVLTRATIRLSKLSAFWKNVDSVAAQMNGAEGFITSAGIGEMPFIRQATFSVWQNKESMKNFAYHMKEHTDVIAKTRRENWYREELFARFKVIKAAGTIKGINPLQRMF